MPQRDQALYLADIVESARLIEQFIGDRDAAAFASDKLLTSAVHSRMVILGEAAARLRPEVRALISSVDWPEIVKFRNFVVHAYFGMSLDRIHDIAMTDVPQLGRAVAAHLAEHHPLILQAIDGEAG